MPRNKGWFRLYDRMIDSPQVLELSDSEFRLLISLWCLCSAEGGNGTISYTAVTIRRRTMPDHSLDEINAMLEHLKQLDLLTGEDGKYQIPHWEEHQYEYASRIPRNRSDLKTADDPKEMKKETTESNREINGKTTESERKENGKIDTDTDTDTEIEIEKEIEIEEGPAVPPLPPNLLQVERQALKELKAVPGYPFDLEKDPELLRSLMIDFPTVDPIDEIKKWRAYKLDHPLAKKSNPRLQLRKWFENAVKWRKEEQLLERVRASPSTFTGPTKKSKYPTLKVIDGKEYFD